MLYFRSDIGSLGLTGTLSMLKELSQASSGNVAITGSVKKYVKKPAVNGAISLSGSISLVVHKVPRFKYVDGLIRLTGTLQKKVGKKVGGNVGLTGTVQKRLFKDLSVGGGLNLYGGLSAGKSNKQPVQGSLGLTGDVALDFGKAVGGELGITGGVSTNIHLLKSLSGALELTGDVGIYIDHVENEGTLNISGDLQKRVTKILSGNVATSGVVENSKTLTFEGFLFAGREASIELSGDLSFTKHFLKSLSGDLSLSGSAHPWGFVDGSLTLTGDLEAHPNWAVSVGGDLGLTGSISFPKHYYVDVDGSLRFMRVLTVGVTPYVPADVSLLNQAASRDIEIEQGVSFRRYYRWMKNDGIPFNVTLFTITMTITTTKDDGEPIAYEAGDITVTTAGLEPGLFCVDIPASITRKMDFTRAVYQIIARWASGAVRLIEGNVILSRGLFRLVDLSVGGSLALSGEIRPSDLKPSGNLSLTGTLSAVKV